ncbi:MAG: exopolysaccharide biosynthesis polyprenyl glycosylphosphotransferase [Clostridiales bacterium]|nr:exopolysaccharide biosynthesis polyprenyl glycosylphosphotransferase [Clostridiales bacterium]
MRVTSVQSKNGFQLVFSIIRFFHFLLSIIFFYIAWIWFRYHSFHVQADRGFRYNYYVLIVYGVLLLFFNRTYDSYLIGYKSPGGLVFSQFLSQFFSLTLVYFIVSFAWVKLMNPVAFLLLLAIQLVLNIIWSFFANRLFFALISTYKTIFVYRNETDKKRFGSILGKPIERLYTICEEIQYSGNDFEEIKDRVQEYDCIFMAGIDSRCRNGIVKYCAEKDIPAFFLPHVGDVIVQGGTHVKSLSSPVYFVSRKRIPLEYMIIKRILDIVVSSLGLVALSPIFLLIAILIHSYDKGPVFYRQIRLAQHGRQFEILKFRSMRQEAEKDGVARLSTGDIDDRVTPIGRFLRKYRIDELPQLINIFLGDMSLVGPRPERPEIAEIYEKFLPDFKLRLQVKPGLTGYAQIYGKYNSSPYEKLEFDLMYINQMSLVTDLQLMFATIGVFFLPESTEGIAAGQTTALNNDNQSESTENSDVTAK